MSLANQVILERKKNVSFSETKNTELEHYVNDAPATLLYVEDSDCDQKYFDIEETKDQEDGNQYEDGSEMFGFMMLWV